MKKSYNFQKYSRWAHTLKADIINYISIFVENNGNSLYFHGYYIIIINYTTAKSNKN